MAEAPESPRCDACDRAASVRIESQALCDRCADRAIAAATGWPELPAPPPPEVIAGPDGERHVFRYRLFRWPGRVVAIAEEVGRGDGGHRLEIGVDHPGDASALRERIRAAARSAVGRIQLVTDEEGRQRLEGDEVIGSAGGLPLDKTEQLLLRREPAQRFVIALDHYPTPNAWVARRQADGLPAQRPD